MKYSVYWRFFVVLLANIESNNNSKFAFPRYTNTSNCNANSASAYLNKWLKDQWKDDYVIHILDIISVTD